MLIAEQAALWQRILDFQLDDLDAAFKFSERLARENGWNLVYTRRVIAEYKRFIFLCCISEHGVTPSDAVDQAWHLHLTFTRSYWIDLCSSTLGKEVHHNPTKGGNSESVKYNTFYTDTNKLYEQAFESQPPLDIWPDNAARFTDIDFRRINMRRNWVIPKPKVRKRLPLLALLILSAAISIQAINNETFVICFLGFFIVLAIVSYKWEGRNKNDDETGNGNGCGTATCGADGAENSGHHDHSGHGCHSGGGNGCSSGCSGCSASGCSGCGSH